MWAPSGCVLQANLPNHPSKAANINSEPCPPFWLALELLCWQGWKTSHTEASRSPAAPGLMHRSIWTHPGAAKLCSLSRECSSKHRDTLKQVEPDWRDVGSLQSWGLSSWIIRQDASADRLAAPPPPFSV